MNIQHTPDIDAKAKILIIPFHKEDINFKKIASISGVETPIKFEAASRECVVLYHPKNELKIYLVGLGSKKDPINYSSIFRSFAFKFKEELISGTTIDISMHDHSMAKSVSNGFVMASYEIGAYKTDKSSSKLSDPNFQLQLVHKSSKCKAEINVGKLCGEAEIRVMNLVDAPANIKTPEKIATIIEESGKKRGFSVKVFHQAELKKQKFDAILAVGNGSENKPVFVKMEYIGPNVKDKSKPIGLVGKGVTFDTGGLSIKGSANMHMMKSDMGGAAAVIGIFELVADLKLNVHLVACLPFAENAVDALSVRPGDVINSYSGKSIEIIDTDAEGRLILADALAYMVKKVKPEVLIDLATLTGSAVRTFGDHCGAMFTNNDQLSEELSKSGNKCFQKVWRLPLWDEYLPEIESDIADVKNLGSKPVAGATTAAKFLEAFTAEHPAWVHLDIAGMAYGSSEFAKMRSASGYGVKLLHEFILNRC